MSVVTEKYLISSNSKFLKSFDTLFAKTIFSQVSYIILEISILSLSPNKELLRLLYITSLCAFITSSYSSNLFLIPKLFSSTFFCALSIEFVIMECCMTSPSSKPILSIILAILSVPNNLIKLSSKET